jgi:hypothetical protein
MLLPSLLVQVAGLVACCPSGSCNVHVLQGMYARHVRKLLLPNSPHLTVWPQAQLAEHRAVSLEQATAMVASFLAHFPGVRTFVDRYGGRIEEHVMWNPVSPFVAWQHTWQVICRLSASLSTWKATGGLIHCAEALGCLNHSTLPCQLISARHILPRLPARHGLPRLPR